MLKFDSHTFPEPIFTGDKHFVKIICVDCGVAVRIHKDIPDIIIYYDSEDKKLKEIPACKNEEINSKIPMPPFSETSYDKVSNTVMRNMNYRTRHIFTNADIPEGTDQIIEECLQCGCPSIKRRKAPFRKYISFDGRVSFVPFDQCLGVKKNWEVVKQNVEAHVAASSLDSTMRKEGEKHVWVAQPKKETDRYRIEICECGLQSKKYKNTGVRMYLNEQSEVPDCFTVPKMPRVCNRLNNMGESLENFKNIKEAVEIVEEIEKEIIDKSEADIEPLDLIIPEEVKDSIVHIEFEKDEEEIPEEKIIEPVVKAQNVINSPVKKRVVEFELKEEEIKLPEKSRFAATKTTKELEVPLHEVEALLKDCIVIIKVMFADLVKNGVDGAGRRIGRNFLHSKGFGALVEQLDRNSL